MPPKRIILPAAVSGTICRISGRILFGKREQYAGNDIDGNQRKAETVTKEEALEIINKENLSVNWFGIRPQEPFEMVIKLSDEGMYQVYGTDERAGVWGVKEEFTSLEDALDNLIYRTRL